jgi:pterin-4a-carbinolamine dehydratase
MARLTTKLKADRIQDKLQADRIQDKLKADRIQQRLQELPGWRTGREGSALVRTFELPTVESAALFASLETSLGESAGFHPTVRLRGNEVTLIVDTDRQDGLTDLDFELAELFSLGSLDPVDATLRDPCPGPLPEDDGGCREEIV